ncbi:MAG TPA: SCO family protein [Methylocystis sp.]|nr:SCO family protein [Methylocystis sp.]
MRFPPCRVTRLCLLLALAVASAAPGAAQQSGALRRLANYEAPPVTLTDSANGRVRLDALLAEDRPVILQFIFTSCTTICGVLTSTVLAAQPELTALRGDYAVLSISIDPEYDTPERLREYAEYFPPDSHWRLLTGRRDDIARVLKAFDAQFSDGTKMSHQAYTFLRAAPGRPWLRLEGLIGCKELVAQYKGLLSDASHVD